MHPADRPRADLPRLACFISGGGRTVLNLADAIDRGDLPAAIALVITDRNCPGIERCQDRGLAVIQTRPTTPESVADLLQSHGIALACLCGYLRLLPVPAAFRGRILNIHPALLPKHGGKGMHGLRVHNAVLDAQDTESGCTVHLCDDRYDTGTPIVQRRCPVLPDDTPQTLADRVFEQERIAYPQAIRTVLARLTDSPAEEYQA